MVAGQKGEKSGGCVNNRPSYCDSPLAQTDWFVPESLKVAREVKCAPPCTHPCRQRHADCALFNFNVDACLLQQLLTFNFIYNNGSTNCACMKCCWQNTYAVVLHLALVGFRREEFKMSPVVGSAGYLCYLDLPVSIEVEVIWIGKLELEDSCAVVASAEVDVDCEEIVVDYKTHTQQRQLCSLCWPWLIPQM